MAASSFLFEDDGELAAGPLAGDVGLRGGRQTQQDTQ